MSNSNKNERTMLGASPLIFLFTFLFTLPLVVLNIIYTQMFEITFIHYNYVVLIASLLLVTGVPLYLIIGKTIKKAFAERKLVTDGMFAYCRNPLFTVVIFLVLPGLLLFANSWLLLTMPVFMLIMVNVFIYREEVQLEEIFGEEYRKYKLRTNAVIPKFW